MADPQHWDPVRYERNAGFVADLGRPLLELLGATRGERVLDLGCGDGRLTVEVADAGCEVVGVDASAEQVDAAHARGIDAEVADARSLPFVDAFDAVLSNATLHWVRPPEDAIDSIARALRPGGRFVAEFGGHGNVNAIVAALDRALTARGLDIADLHPWYFPTPEEYADLLTARGFDVESIELIPRPTAIPGDVVDWLATFGESFTNPLPADRRADFLDEVRRDLAGTLVDADGRWVVDYVRLRVRAVLAQDVA